MLKVISTRVAPGEEVIGDVSVLHPPTYSIVCEDKVGNNFEVETNKDTYVQITNFLDKLREV